MFWSNWFRKKKETPLPPETIANDLGGVGPYWAIDCDEPEVELVLVKTQDIENPFEEVEMPVTKVYPSIVDTPPMQVEIKKMQAAQKAKAAMPEEPIDYYALYVYDTETFACGPFKTKREAKIWLSGLRHFENSDVTVIGVVSDLDDASDVEYESPQGLDK